MKELNPFFTGKVENSPESLIVVANTDCGQFNEKEIAYSAWLAGIDDYIKRDIKRIEIKETNNE